MSDTIRGKILSFYKNCYQPKYKELVKITKDMGLSEKDSMKIWLLFNDAFHDLPKFLEDKQYGVNPVELPMLLISIHRSERLRRLCKVELHKREDSI